MASQDIIGITLFALIVCGVLGAGAAWWAYHRGHRAGMAHARRLDADPFDAKAVTKDHPWSIVEHQVFRMRLLHRLQDSCVVLHESGFLTDKEMVRIQTRIAVWRADRVRQANAENKHVLDDGPPF